MITVASLVIERFSIDHAAAVQEDLYAQRAVDASNRPCTRATRGRRGAHRLGCATAPRGEKVAPLVGP